MTKKDLIMCVSNTHPNILKKNVEEAIDLFFEMIAFYLAHNQRVELRGFGIFSIRERAAHKAHNPQTGATLEVPAKKVPFFRASQLLKKQLKEAAEEKKVKSTSRRKGFFSNLYNNMRM